MKLAIFALLAVLFLGVVGVKSGAIVKSERNELDQYNDYLKDALENVLNCYSSLLGNIKEAGIQISKDLAGCGASTDQGKKLLESIENIFTEFNETMEDCKTALGFLKCLPRPIAPDIMSLPTKLLGIFNIESVGCGVDATIQINSKVDKIVKEIKQCLPWN